MKRQYGYDQAAEFWFFRIWAALIVIIVNIKDKYDSNKKNIMQK